MVDAPSLSLHRGEMGHLACFSFQEREKGEQERCCKISASSLDLPMAFTREKNPNKRKGIFRPRSVLLEESPAGPPNNGYFTQQHNDAKSFMEEHFTVKISPFPSCHQIARKDHLWTNYRVRTAG